MALVMTILTVVAMLGGITVLLWLSTWVESKHLGPAAAGAVDLAGVDVAGVDVLGVEAAAEVTDVTEPAPALGMVEVAPAA